MTSSSWFQRLQPQPDARVRLFCFHHAGGSAAAFRLWPRRLPEFDVCAVQLPGRANRLAEPPLESLPAIAQALLPPLGSLLDRPFAFFGHSMGTAVAWIVAQQLQAAGGPQPVHLFLSGRQPPHRPFPERSLRGLDDAQVVQEINVHFGGFPPEALAHPELMELMLPPLRADFEALEDPLPPPAEPLGVPMTAMGGLSDPCAARDHLEPWQAYTSRPLRIRHFPGDHFYLDERLDEIVATLRATLVAEPAPLPGRWAA